MLQQRTGPDGSAKNRIVVYGRPAQSSTKPSSAHRPVTAFITIAAPLPD